MLHILCLRFNINFTFNFGKIVADFISRKQSEKTEPYICCVVTNSNENVLNISKKKTRLNLRTYYYLLKIFDVIIKENLRKKFVFNHIFFIILSSKKNKNKQRDALFYSY